jgi:quercetin dioxygenase-like cupin family protein
MTLAESIAYALKSGQGRSIWFLGGLLTWKVVSVNTKGRYEMVEQRGAHGFGAPVHSHERETEGFYVLKGDMTFVLDNKKVYASDGDFLFVPSGAKHAFVVDSKEAKFLTIIAPAGLEAFCDELGGPARALRVPPRSVGIPSPERIEAIAVKYGQKVLGPPPTPRDPSRLKHHH